MTASERFDRDFADLLADLAQPQLPDYLDGALQLAVSHRQRPAWTFPERWIPMGVRTRRIPLAPALPSRTIGLLVMLLLLLLATVVIGVGALLLQQQQRPAPPFGIAANGVMAYSQDGDIYTHDPATGESRLIVGGPTVDVEPWFTRDGTGVIFVRVLETEPAETIELIIADVNGANPRTLLGPVPGDEVRWVELSPDGLLLAIASADTAQLSVLDLGTGARTLLDLPVEVELFEWLPDSSTIVVHGIDGRRPALYAVPIDGSDFRRLTDDIPGTGYDARLSISHDGRFVSYNAIHGSTHLFHILDLETGEDHVRVPPMGTHEGLAVFSPDHQLLAFVRWTPDAQAYIGPIDGGSDPTPIGPRASRSNPYDKGIVIQFSPDGASLLIASDDGAVWLADVATGSYEEVTWNRDEFPIAWQRLAP